MQSERTTNPLEWARAISRDPSNGLSWQAIAVARTLADHANRAGVCAVLQATIATESRISMSAAGRGLRELCDGSFVLKHRTRGASVYVLQFGQPDVSEPSQTGHTDRSDDASSVPLTDQISHTDRQKKALKENQEVNLSKGSYGDGNSSRADEVLIPVGSFKGDDPATKGLDSFPVAVQQLAPTAWRILNGGFLGLIDPKPEWRRPSAYRVAKVIENLGTPHTFLVEQAAQEARITMQQREDGRNVVGLFEHKLRTEVDKAAQVHERLLADFELMGALPDAGQEYLEALQETA